MAVTDHQVSLLLNQGLLTRHTGGPDGYLFSMPNAGLAVRSVAGERTGLAVLQGLAGARAGNMPCLLLCCPVSPLPPTSRTLVT